MQSNSLEQPRQAGRRRSKVTPLSKITSSHKSRVQSNLSCFI